MAKWCPTFVATAAVMVLTGCQPAEPVAMVKNLPPPNFDGPTDLTPPPPAPLVRPPAPAVVPPKTGIAANVPGGWVPPIRANAWRWIIIHHSATPGGSATSFDRMHRQKGWDELGYHFVVGNGSDTKDGQVEVGPRWRKQKWGAHAKTPDNKYNEYGIGICVVGNFDVTRPSARQLEAVSKLVAHLQRTYKIPSERVIGHGTVHTFDKGGTSTDCPGRNMSITQIRRLSGQILAEAGDIVPTEVTAATANNGGNLLYNVTTPGH